MPSCVRIREVGPRDGLQGESPVAVPDRVRLVSALAAAGLGEIEAVAFVSPRAVPAMAGAAEVLAGLDRDSGAVYVALVPNVRGAELALEAGAEALNVTISASREYSHRNVGQSIEESLAGLRSICALAAGRPVDATVSCAFGSPYEGDIEAGVVATVGARASEAGATSLTFADTTGMATPRRVEELVASVGTEIRLHFHETRGTGLVNAYAALQLGVTAFDTSIGGLGGSPFVAGAGGNLATEGLVHLLDDLGVTSGVSLERLLEAAALAQSLVKRVLPSPVAAAGPRSRLAPA
ncbi:MAG: hydroxymethylglutaryl-CoA lyase [Actinobacteria bacterium]|nr:hydroxymethylglutaryl-CoA lyase [Actinomycetota bacterium]